MPKIDEKKYFDMFILMEKITNHPEKLTRAERKRLKELGIIRDENWD